MKRKTHVLKKLKKRVINSKKYLMIDYNKGNKIYRSYYEKILCLQRCYFQQKRTKEESDNEISKDKSILILKKMKNMSTMSIEGHFEIFKTFLAICE